MGCTHRSALVAQHVFLAEPLLERAVEAQAIGRVHRMSQTRPTVVHRFVMRDTIEESILGLRQASADAAADAAADDATDPTSPARGASGSAAAGSPNKRQRRAEESKLLSWETVQALFSPPKPAPAEPLPS